MNNQWFCHFPSFSCFSDGVEAKGSNVQNKAVRVKLKASISWAHSILIFSSFIHQEQRKGPNSLRPQHLPRKRDLKWKGPLTRSWLRTCSRQWRRMISLNSLRMHKLDFYAKSLLSLIEEERSIECALYFVGFISAFRFVLVSVIFLQVVDCSTSMLIYQFVNFNLTYLIFYLTSLYTHMPWQYCLEYFVLQQCLWTWFRIRNETSQETNYIPFPESIQYSYLVSSHTTPSPNLD